LLGDDGNDDGEHAVAESFQQVQRDHRKTLDYAGGMAAHHWAERFGSLPLRQIGVKRGSNDLPAQFQREQTKPIKAIRRIRLIKGAMNVRK